MSNIHPNDLTPAHVNRPAVVATVGGREYAWSGHRPDDIQALAFLLKEAAA